MRKTKRGGANLSRKMKLYQPIVASEKYRDARKVIEYSGDQLQLDQQKEEILERELQKVKRDEKKHRMLKQKGQRALLEVLAANQMLSVMNNLVMMSDVKQLLSDPSKKHTLIFPTDDNLLESDLDIEKLKQNKDALNQFLKDYILQGEVHSEHLKPETPVTVFNSNGKALDIVKRETGKIIVKYDNKPVAVIKHKDLTHHDDSLPVAGSIHSIQDLETQIPSAKDIAEDGKKQIQKFREGATNAVSDARERLKGATDTAENVGKKATELATGALKTITGFFGGDKQEKTSDADSSAPVASTPTVSQQQGGRRRRKRKTKKRKHVKNKKRRSKKRRRN